MSKPLGMPEGSIRAIVFLMLSITVCILAFIEKNVMQETLKLAFGVVVGFYYGSKVGEQNGGTK